MGHKGGHWLAILVVRQAATPLPYSIVSYWETHEGIEFVPAQALTLSVILGKPPIPRFSFVT
jgi:hypothetical protein